MLVTPTNMTLVAALAVTVALSGEEPPGRAAPAEERRPVVHRQDLAVQVELDVDLAASRVKGALVIQNRTDRAQQLAIGGELAGKDLASLALKPKESRRVAVSQPLTAVALGPRTSVTTVRPYLLLGTPDGTQRLLLANYDLDVKVLLPANARVVKCSPSPTGRDATGLVWKMRGMTTLPPLRVWYTTAAEKIDVLRTVTWADARATVRVKVSNQGSDRAEGLDLRTQLPRTLYEPVHEKSDGTFVEDGEDMWLWKLRVERLAPGETQTFAYTVAGRGRATPTLDREVLVYNSTGDLIAAQ
jgi:hypothetical protein